jgi:hypothetical protein
VTFVAIQVVVIVTAVKTIGSLVAIDYVLTAVAICLVVASIGKNSVVVFGALERIVTVGPIDDGHL